MTDGKSWEMGYTAGLTGQSTQEPLFNSGWRFHLRGHPALILVRHIPYTQESASGGLRFLHVPENVQDGGRRHIANCPVVQQE